MHQYWYVLVRSILLDPVPVDRIPDASSVPEALTIDAWVKRQFYGLSLTFKLGKAKKGGATIVENRDYNHHY